MTVTTIDPHTALVVIDLQHGIVGLPLSPIPAADVIARSAELARAFRARGLPVVLVRVSGGPAAPGRTDAPSRGGARAEGWDEIVDELRGDGDIVVTKRNWGAFFGTDLDLQLRRRGVTQIVLTGIATSAGVESTARAAHEHGYHVTLAVDAMSDRDPDIHRNSIERIFPRLGESGTTAEIIEVLG
jgi:nicotinamidase-related amidase